MRYSAWNQRRRNLRLPPWQVGLLLVVALALGIAVAIVATGVLLIALPIAALVVLGYKLFGGRRRHSERAQRRTIEGEYEVVNRGRAEEAERR